MNNDLENARLITCGKTIRMLGGIPYPAQKRNLEQALACTILWEPSRSSKCSRNAQRRVFHADLVIAAVKLSSHAAIDRALANHRAGGAPLVLAKAGLNPNRIAYDIVNQLSQGRVS